MNDHTRPMWLVLFTLLVVAAPVAPAWGQTVIFVDASATGSGNGSSWADAYTSVQPALNAATSGKQVWVASGRYVGKITLKLGVALYGGFAGAEDPATFDLADRDLVANETILDGNRSGSVVTAPSGATATTRIDGFTITNGTGKVSGSHVYGGGLYVLGSSPTIANNIIKSNTVAGDYGYGGGLYLSNSSATIASNTIMSNTVAGSDGSNGYGGGLYLSNSSPTIANNTITANTATGSSGKGGGLYLSSGSPTIANNTITGNGARDGGGLYLSSSSPTIANTIIVLNSSGVYRSGGTPTLRHNCVYGNARYNYSGLTDPTGTDGNIAADPRLADPAYGNAHLGPDSPCVDAGANADAYGYADIDGQPRINPEGGTVDIGADESDGTVWPPGPYGVVRVRPDGDDAHDGSSWDSAKRTVQAGISAASALGGEVWVQAGTYGERLTLHPYAHVYGGFAGGETERDARDWRANVTVLDGQQQGSVVIVLVGEHASTLDGFTVTNGTGTLSGSPPYDGSNGGGLYLSACSPTIANNKIAGNTVTGSQGVGGGLYLSFSSATIANNTITGNTANGGQGVGGGLYLYSSSSMIANNTITGNGASSGGGLYLSSSSPTIANSIIAFNSSGVYGSSSIPTFRHNCVHGNAAYNYSGLTDPTGTDGNLSTDPHLADLAYGNAHLQPDSPCVNAGANADVFGDTDIDRQPRIQPAGGTVDIGADESDGTVWPPGPYGVVRVRPDGDDAHDGSSWALAKRTVQAGISAASALGGEVWVQAGTYGERVTLHPYAHVYGGFAGGETDRDARDWRASVTVLDGQQQGSVVTVLAGEHASTLDGFTITKGTGTLVDTSSGSRCGGGLYLSNSSPTIVNNSVTGNTVPGSYYSNSRGAGLYLSYSAPTIANNTITHNSAWSSGGGLYLSYSAPTIVDNTILSNTVTRREGYGGGLSLSNSSPTIANNTIIGNSASAYGGGLSLSNSSPTIANNTIMGNTVVNRFGYGGGLRLDSNSSPTIVNNTIAGNGARSGGGLYLSSSSPTIANSIVAFNSSGVYGSGGTPTLRHNCVYGNTAYNYSGLTNPTGTSGNISADPRLASSQYGNMHVQPDSPCVNAGANADAYGDADMDGEPRIQPGGGTVDIGADEADGGVWPTGPYGIVRVRPDGDDAHNGSSWELAKRTVQAGINAASTLGGEVWVQAGTYGECITLLPYAHVYGGFGGGEPERDARDWLANVTVLDGQQQGSVVTVLAGERASTLDGFTITKGTGTLLDPSSDSRCGGGLYLSSSSPMIANNVITNNTTPGSSYSDSDGAGLYLSSASPAIANNTITGNSAWGDGGGLYLDSNSSPTIANNTIAGNGARSGGGLYLYSNSSPTIANTIVAFNSSGLSGSGSTPTLRHNCVYGNTAYNYSGLPDPTGTSGNISADPRLASSQYRNMHLQPDSPCVNAGANADAYGDADMDGEPRIQPGGGTVDIGADESDGTVWPPGPCRIVRVRPDGDDAHDGSSWALAKRMVQAGINAASALGGEVWVQAGTYAERLTLHPYVHAYGGFAGGETARGERDWSVNVTILDGQQQGTVVTVLTGEHASTLDGFTITHGTGTGIKCFRASPTIANNTITGNSSPAYGGGLYLSRASPTIANNTISHNSASSSGGGLYLSSSSPTIANNTIVGNTVTDSRGSGGGLYLSSSSPTIAGNSVVGNAVTGTYGSGGGLYLSSSSPTVANNAITGNTVAGTAGQGGGLYLDYSSPTIANNTISGNGASHGGGLYLYNSSPTISNTIVAFNSSGVHSGTPTFRYSCVYGNTAYNYSGLTDPTGTNGNISADPRFMQYTGDLHLLADSPCVDAGDNASVPADTADLDGDGDHTEPLPFDLDGHTRIVDGDVDQTSIVDIGAYEYWPDCNGNGVPDADDLGAGTSVDCQTNGIPDECEPDCNSNGIADECDILSGTSLDADGNGTPDECEAPVPVILQSALPPNQGTLWRSAKNIMRLTFDRDLTTAPAAGQLVIQELLAGGGFGPDLSAGFAFAIDTDPRVLKIRETGVSLTHRTWYAIRNAGGWPAAADFEVQYVVLMGDVDDNGFVQNLDAGAIYPNVSPLPKPDDYRYDVDGNGYCQNLDAGSVFPKVSPLPKPAKPSGH